MIYLCSADHSLLLIFLIFGTQIIFCISLEGFVRQKNPIIFTPCLYELLRWLRAGLGLNVGEQAIAFEITITFLLFYKCFNDYWTMNTPLTHVVDWICRKRFNGNANIVIFYIIIGAAYVEF